MSKKIPVKMCMDLLTFTMRARTSLSGNGNKWPYKDTVVKNITNRILSNTKNGEIAEKEVEKMIDLLNDTKSLGWD